ncbi:MAG: sigma-70 family RNA polymerase sigma factor [Pseudomonadota bacterium]
MGEELAYKRPFAEDRRTENGRAGDDHDQTAARRPSTAFTLEKLYRTHASDLTRFLRKEFGPGPPEPEDVAHEAFQKLAEQIDLSRIANPRAFLWRTARNLILTKKRNAGRRSKFDYEIELFFFASGGPKNNPEGVLEVNQQLDAVKAVIRSMPDNRRKAFLWRRLEGVKMGEIAERLGVSRRAVSKHLERAIIDIEDALGPKRS